jgi:hypothetical protein
MVKTLTLVLAVAVLVTGCGRVAESRFNPLNWFGRDEPVRTAAPGSAVDQDPRPLVAQVSSVSIERTPEGAILRAVGLPPTQGFWDPALLYDETRSAPGLLVYQFRLAQPETQQRTVNEASREVTTALFLSEQTLAGVREIQVLGVTGSRAVRR